jgi:hypothetical protein
MASGVGPPRGREEVLKLHGMGPKVIEHIRRALAASGKAFAEYGKSNE